MDLMAAPARLTLDITRGGADVGDGGCGSVLIIKEKLADLYESEHQWSRVAAQMLSGIDLDSGIRFDPKLLSQKFLPLRQTLVYPFDIMSKQNTRRVQQTLKMCPNCSSLYLEDDDAVNAEAFINKASFLVSNSQHEVLHLQYKKLVTLLKEQQSKATRLKEQQEKRSENLQRGDPSFLLHSSHLLQPRLEGCTIHSHEISI
ncbi:hypothetical protein ACLOJK_034015 [Asimina triloba]